MTAGTPLTPVPVQNSNTGFLCVCGNVLVLMKLKRMIRMKTTLIETFIIPS